MPLIALHPVQTAAVHGDDSALHVNQIILAQVLSFQSKIVPYRRHPWQTLLEPCDFRFDLLS
jgi:hypothetical protein